MKMYYGKQAAIIHVIIKSETPTLADYKTLLKKAMNRQRTTFGYCERDAKKWIVDSVVIICE
jgi:hypothetical protein